MDTALTKGLSPGKAQALLTQRWAQRSGPPVGRERQVTWWLE